MANGKHSQHLATSPPSRSGLLCVFFLMLSWCELILLPNCLSTPHVETIKRILNRPNYVSLWVFVGPNARTLRFSTRWRMCFPEYICIWFFGDTHGIGFRVETLEYVFIFKRKTFYRLLPENRQTGNETISRNSYSPFAVRKVHLYVQLIT